MQVDVPEGCSLTIHPVAKVEAGSVPDQHEDEVVWDARCGCGEWELEEQCSTLQSVETQARAAWLTQHLLKDEAKP